MPPWAADLSPAERTRIPVICCGANSMGWFFLQAAKHLNIIGLVDDFKKGQEYCGHTCIGMPEMIALAKRNPNAICVNLAQWDRGVRFFDNLGRRFNLRILNFGQAVRYFDCEQMDFRLADWRPAIVSRGEEFLALEDMLCDELSKQTLFAVLTHHLDNNREHLLGINRAYDAHYFRSGLFELRKNEIFVDCGAAVGETVDHFLEMTEERFTELHAFEPDCSNFGQLSGKIDRYRNLPFFKKIFLHNQATGDSDRKVAFEHGGGEGSRVIDAIDGEGSMDLVRLDSALQNGATFLKLDVEGHELASLRGAEQIIQECKPRIAVCVYHRDDDLLTIPAYLKALNPDYQIGLRHCNQVRFDTICFAF
ncbi:MAG: FkbM family methyltransferase [Chthoniobacteraceae bacterium]